MEDQDVNQISRRRQVGALFQGLPVSTAVPPPPPLIPATTGTTAAVGYYLQWKYQQQYVYHQLLHHHHHKIGFGYSGWRTPKHSVFNN